MSSRPQTFRNQRPPRPMNTQEEVFSYLNQQRICENDGTIECTEIGVAVKVKRSSALSSGPDLSPAPLTHPAHTFGSTEVEPTTTKKKLLEEIMHQIRKIQNQDVDSLTEEIQRIYRHIRLYLYDLDVFEYNGPSRQKSAFEPNTPETVIEMLNESIDMLNLETRVIYHGSENLVQIIRSKLQRIRTWWTQRAPKKDEVMPTSTTFDHSESQDLSSDAEPEPVSPDHPRIKRAILKYSVALVQQRQEETLMENLKKVATDIGIKNQTQQGINSVYQAMSLMRPDMDSEFCLVASKKIHSFLRQFNDESIYDNFLEFVRLSTFTLRHSRACIGRNDVPNNISSLVKCLYRSQLSKVDFSKYEELLQSTVGVVSKSVIDSIQKHRSKQGSIIVNDIVSELNSRTWGLVRMNMTENQWLLEQRIEYLSQQKKILNNPGTTDSSPVYALNEYQKQNPKRALETISQDLINAQSQLAQLLQFGVGYGRWNARVIQGIIPPGFTSIGRGKQHIDEWEQDTISQELLLLNRFDHATDQVKTILYQDAVDCGVLQEDVRSMEDWRRQLEKTVKSQYFQKNHDTPFMKHFDSKFSMNEIIRGQTTRQQEILLSKSHIEYWEKEMAERGWLNEDDSTTASVESDLYKKLEMYLVNIETSSLMLESSTNCRVNRYGQVEELIDGQMLVSNHRRQELDTKKLTRIVLDKMTNLHGIDPIDDDFTTDLSTAMASLSFVCRQHGSTMSELLYDAKDENQAAIELVKQLRLSKKSHRRVRQNGSRLVGTVEAVFGPPRHSYMSSKKNQQQKRSWKDALHNALEILIEEATDQRFLQYSQVLVAACESIKLAGGALAFARSQNIRLHSGIQSTTTDREGWSSRFTDEVIHPVIQAESDRMAHKANQSIAPSQFERHVVDQVIQTESDRMAHKANQSKRHDIDFESRVRTQTRPSTSVDSFTENITNDNNKPSPVRMGDLMLTISEARGVPLTDRLFGAVSGIRSVAYVWGKNWIKWFGSNVASQAVSHLTETGAKQLFTTMSRDAQIAKLRQDIDSVLLSPNRAQYIEEIHRMMGIQVFGSTSYYENINQEQLREEIIEKAIEFSDGNFDIYHQKNRYAPSHH